MNLENNGNYQMIKMQYITISAVMEFVLPQGHFYATGEDYSNYAASDNSTINSFVCL